MQSSARRNAIELFFVSVLVLFLELACIRWFPAHVLLLTFFTNSVLLACFLGMAIGCLVARHGRSYLRSTPWLLLLALALAHGAELMPRMERMVDVGDSSQVVFFGAIRYTDPARFFIPIEALCGLFFVLLCLANVGPGQELGRALSRVPDRVRGYTIHIAGSLAGIALFTLSSYLELPPVFWFSVIAGLVSWLLAKKFYIGRLRIPPSVANGVPLVLMVTLASWRSGSFTFDRRDEGTTYWSPYYRIDYIHPPRRNIAVNLIGHQQMEPLDRLPEYSAPYLLSRDAQRLASEEPKTFDDVLVIGAGSGNDVSRALQFGAGHIDAVEIDPVIERLGRRDHPARPYSDPRVTTHSDDGRNFLRASDKKYDLIVYALVDSLVLHSSFSNLRLESYLFTREAFEDVRRHLKPGGLFVAYNYFRQGWVVGRVEKTLKAAFGADPLVLMLPYRDSVEPDATFESFTVFLSGTAEAIAPVHKAFDDHGGYWLDAVNAGPEATRNGFLDKPSSDAIGATDGSKEHPRWIRFDRATVVPPAEDLPIATDDWPFLYLRKPMIPSLSLRSAAIMGGLAVLLLWWFDRRGRAAGRAKTRSLDLRMFFLGAGFMLLEAKAVVRMALLFGSTWVVNSIVFAAVLVVILLANVFVLRWRPQNVAPHYAGLALALFAGVLVPMETFLGMPRTAQVVLASAVVAAPILFAGVIFAVSFARAAEPERALGANIAGAMLGGLAEYASMRLGFQQVGYIAVGFYGLAILAGHLADRARAEALVLGSADAGGQ